LLVLASPPGEAHKPITSPYTFNEDVFPIVRDRCAACHVKGGVAPMSLLTHAEAVPWGESMRVELMAGHMPPFGVDTAPGRFRNVQALTARELNVLLTWASGGTPVGDPEKSPAPAARDQQWPLGPPDLVLPVPMEVTLPVDQQERVEEFSIDVPTTTARWLRAVDVLPGTPAIVRSAVVSVAPAADAPAAAIGGAPERLLALWLPGDHPVPLDPGAAFQLPAGATLTVRVRYRKTWEYERAAMSDRSSVGLYFAEGPATELRALRLSARPAPAGLSSSEPPPAAVIDETLQAVAIYPERGLPAAAVRVTALRPDGSREELIAFRPQPGWERRYWFREPIVLPRGTRIEVRAAFDDEGMLPPGALPTAAQSSEPSTVRLTLNVIAGS
jgi:hypothetical protein